ncbi:hypothetical protein ACFX5Q_05945 [Mesorhizobium sp. IMUNJ 23033]|uniref:hypothetical protein n=1 Tax=Mesorhizobium sp. IMUNJ 23033 TaxID=3378039 RepID=UPI00384D8171
MQHLLDEGVGGVAAGHLVLADHVDETGGRQLLAVVARIAPEVQSEPGMCHQPALLGGKDGSKTRVPLIGLEQCQRLRPDIAVQCRMTGNLFSVQRHPPRSRSRLVTI